MIHDKQNFPSKSQEMRGRFVGLAQTVGDSLTYKVLSDDTQKVIHRSSLRSAETKEDRNLRLDKGTDEDKEPIVFIKSRSDDETVLKLMPGYSPEDLIGRTFLKDVGEENF